MCGVRGSVGAGIVRSVGRKSKNVGSPPIYVIK